MKLFPFLSACVSFIGKVWSLRCYACMGTQPGCSTDDLDWRLVKNVECPDSHDVCVKITEFMMGSYLTTRGCLSDMTSLRRDIPGDRYEGCRGSAVDVRFNKDVAVSHPHPLSVASSDAVFCFCAWDNYCNAATNRVEMKLAIASTMLILLLVSMDAYSPFDS